MSRIGKMPLPLPRGVTVSINSNNISVKGILGFLQLKLDSVVCVKIESEVLYFSIVGDHPNANAMFGTARALVANMIIGVTLGFKRKLLLVGVGYRASVSGSTLTLQVGFSHPVIVVMPSGLTVKCATPSEIEIEGIDIQAVGQQASEIRSVRPPEPYKGKGIRYSDEKPTLKETTKKK
jgi:large subunit ribosomal protein L6